MKGRAAVRPHGALRPYFHVWPERSQPRTEGRKLQTGTHGWPPFPKVAHLWARTSSVLTLSTVSMGVGQPRSGIHLNTHTSQQLQQRFFEKSKLK